MRKDSSKDSLDVVDRPAVGRLASLSAALLLSLASSSSAADTYLKASIDQAGKLRIVTKDGREIVPEKEAGEVGFDKAAISPDGRSVGWVALYPNCCTSYPIPLGLVIYTNGRVRIFGARVGLPVWQWCFVAGGKQVPSTRRKFMEVSESITNCGMWPRGA